MSRVAPHLLEEVKLYSNASERNRYDNLADVYAKVVMIEHLEKAFARSAIDPQKYQDECQKLIGQYKISLLSVGGEIGDDPEQFFKQYRLQWTAAKRRLQIGVPATIEWGVGAGKKTSDAKAVAATVSSFITIMDSLQIQMNAVDEIHPYMADLMGNLNKCNLPADFVGKTMTMQWLQTLNGMKASDNLSEDQKRQLLFDLEKSYNAFNQSLE
eukprot:m.81601 g.81601  ORF g.81601 m.81601 type:complete len:213 (-) comp14697_c0_seq3:28-666(-)